VAWPIRDQIAAVSVGIDGGTPRLDLEYVEDQVAEVDMNVVATASNAIVEIQGTGEKRSFRREEMDALVDLAFQGIRELAAAQNEVLAPTLEQVREVLARGPRKPAPPKSEKNLWGRP
jgi:ribonuclease PH